MQLGFLSLERPPDVLNYLPSFCKRKKISSSADDDLGPALKTRANFLEESLNKDFIRLAFRQLVRFSSKCFWRSLKCLRRAFCPSLESALRSTLR